MAVLDFLTELTLDQLFGDSLDAIAATAVDTQTYQTILVSNVGRQAIPVIVNALPNSPFLASSGIVYIQPGTNVLAESQRFSPAQLQSLTNMSLVKTSQQAITVRT